jgi:creatinine amidohydrolase
MRAREDLTMPIPAGDKLWELRWNEVAALDRRSTLIIQPTGAIEQHGHHLPIDTDIFNSTNIALRAAAAVNARGAGKVLVAPPLWWGTSPHHLAYPGTISLRMETMSAVLVDICASLAKHGFYRILFLNGHGGNVGVLTATALRISEEVGITPAVASYWGLIRDTLRSLGESANGGMGHACEMETSMQLHFRAERVALDQARLDMPRQLTSFSCVDFRDPGPVMIPWDFMRDSKTGAMGDPTKASGDKGGKIIDAAVDRVVALAGELLALTAEDLHSGPAGEALLDTAGQQAP